MLENIGEILKLASSALIHIAFAPKPGLTSLLLSAMIMETPDWFSDVNRFFRMIQNW